ncbi:hypothetical protein KKA14_10270, partial [bacterium]|nr:hypothetical protein [bacterium]
IRTFKIFGDYEAGEADAMINSGDKIKLNLEKVNKETVKNTLHDMLPEMMEKIIHEELED